jgi:hypothetical protein
MLAANAELDAGPRRSPALGRDLHQFADAFAVDRDERVAREDALFDVGGEKRRRVVARNAECGLRQVVGAEGKEFRRLRDFRRLRAPPAAARSWSRPDNRS